MKTVFFQCAMIAVLAISGQAIKLNESEDQGIYTAEIDSHHRHCQSQCMTYEKLSKAVDT